MYNIIMALLFGGAVIGSSDKVTEVKNETLVTNSWEVAISLYERGETLTPEIYNWTIINNICITNGWNNAVYINGIDPWRHKCAECSKEHFSDYPKSNVVFEAVQNKIDCTIYRGTNILTKTIRYSHPIKKITTTTKLEIIIKTNIVSVIRPVSQIIKTNTTLEKLYIESTN